jgi:hypothetical protein
MFVIYCCFGKMFNPRIWEEYEYMAFLRHFGTYRKSLYKQHHLESLLGGRFDKLKMEGRLFENSVCTVGNA